MKKTPLPDPRLHQHSPGEQFKIGGTEYVVAKDGSHRRIRILGKKERPLALARQAEPKQIIHLAARPDDDRTVTQPCAQERMVKTFAEVEAEMKNPRFRR